MARHEMELNAEYIINYSYIYIYVYIYIYIYIHIYIYIYIYNRYIYRTIHLVIVDDCK